MRAIVLLCLALVSGCAIACDSDSTDHECVCRSATAPAESVVASCTAMLADSALSTERRAGYLHLRSLAYHRAGDATHAMQDIDARLKLEPNAAAYVLRSALHGERREYAASIADSNRALELDPRMVDALRNLGKAHSDSGDHANALKDYQRGVALAPDDGPLNGAVCWERAVLGIELDAALADCTKALTGKRDDANPFNSRGFVRFRLGDAAGAVRDYDRAIALAPDVPSSYYMRGRAKALVGDATANEDIAHGVAGEPGVAARYASYGVKPD